MVDVVSIIDEELTRSPGFAIWALGAVLLGAGTAMVHPTATALVSAVVAVGMYEPHRPGAGASAAAPPFGARVPAAPPAGLR